MGFKEFLSTGWNGFKSGVGTGGQYLQSGWNGIKSGAGQAGKWIWNNRESLASAGGDAALNLGMMTANPALMAVGGGLKGYSHVAGALKGVPDGTAKTALMNNIVNYQTDAANNYKKLKTNAINQNMADILTSGPYKEASFQTIPQNHTSTQTSAEVQTNADATNQLGMFMDSLKNKSKSTAMTIAKRKLKKSKQMKLKPEKYRLFKHKTALKL